MTLISDTESWKKLSAASDKLSSTTLRRLFDEDPGRAERYSLQAAGLFLDFSKNKLTDDVVEGLCALAREAGLEELRRAMLSGEKINATEGRAVLHVALRDFALRNYLVDGESVTRLVEAERDRMARFVASVHQGDRRGFSGETLDTVVNIGIGGSDLGPQMASEALRPFWVEGRRSYYVSNVDGQHLSDVLADLDPARTLFVVASKTFTTQETMTNAQSARDWFCQNGGSPQDVAKHFVALSVNERAVSDFGIDLNNMFRFWDWVGGRYSLWSVIGLSLVLQIGYQNFEQMLRGAHAMDEHFRDAPIAENMPVMMALTGVWNRNFQNIGAHAVLPYDQHLHRLPAYLQQADMESNGKSVLKDGRKAPYATGPVIFGEPGTNGQHAFYQLMHQGSDVISADFIAAAKSARPLSDHHEKLLANFLAQPEAFMRGKSYDEACAELRDAGFTAKEIEKLAPHKVFVGDRPTNSILMETLTPHNLGALIALYEHKIFCQGAIWGLNSFDQWGVELGKALAKKILPDLGALGVSMPEASGHDASTNQLIDWINKARAAE